MEVVLENSGPRRGCQGSQRSIPGERGSSRTGQGGMGKDGCPTSEPGNQWRAAEERPIQQLLQGTQDQGNLMGAGRRAGSISRENFGWEILAPGIVLEHHKEPRPFLVISQQGGTWVPVAVAWPLVLRQSG